jgi:putative DNA primase/helicase
MYLFNGAYWKIIDEAQIKKFLGRVAWQMGVRVTDARDISFKDKLYSLFVYNTLLDPPKTDDTSVLINLQNGTLEVSSNIMQEPTLREYRAEDFLRYQLPFEYNPMAKAPTFLKYLYEVLPEEDKRNVLAEYMGYVFIRHSSKSMKLEKCLMLFGSGANGKSVFFEVMNALFGRENTTNKTLEDLTTGSNFKNSLAEIDGKLLNYDSDFGKNIKADTFKKMVSGEPLEARRLYKQPYEMNDYAKLIFNTNNLPSVSEHTRAYFRRFLIIPFEVEIPEERQDNELHKKIIDKELSGVLNWVLDGLERLMKQRKFTPCPSADAMLKQYQKESDSAMMFMEEEQYQKSEGTTTLLKVLYSQYRDFCLDAGLKPLSNRNFAQRLKNAGYQSDKGREGKYFYVFRQKSAF